MGYDLHITRAEDWANNQGSEIPADEWLAVVHDDPELKLDPPNGSYSVLWSGDSSVDAPWLDWFEGNIYTTNPDRAMLAKMLQIAAFLRARVQGDKGEIYASVHDLEEETLS
jgi:hypothetical protein